MTINFYAKIKKAIIFFLIFLLAFLICMNSPLNIFTKNKFTATDSSVFHFIGINMINGKIPYKDLFDHKGIIIYFINYLGSLISQQGEGIWFIELCFMLISLLVAYKICRKFTNEWKSLLIILLVFAPLYKYFEGGNFTEEYSLPFQLISLNIFIDFFINPNKYFIKKSKNSLRFHLNIPAMVSGICLACVFFLKANLISLWLVFPLLIMIYCLKKKKYLELIEFIFSFLVGTLIILLPILLYLIKNDVLKYFIDAYIIFNMQYSSSTNIEKLTAFGYFLISPIVIIAFFSIILKIFIQIRKKEKGFIFNLGYLCYMTLNILSISVSGKTYSHYGISLIPILIYPYCLIYNLFKKKNNSLIISIFFLTTLIIPPWFNLIESNLPLREENSNIEKVTDYIKDNTNENDKISVFGNWNIIYNLANRESASKYSYQTPLIKVDKQIEKEYYQELRENKPKLIVWRVEEKRYNVQNAKNLERFLNENNYKLEKIINNVKIYGLNEN